MHLLFASHQLGRYKSLLTRFNRHSKIRKLSQATRFLEIVRQVEKGCYDLVLLDWELPGLAPQRQLDFIEGICPLAQIIVITDKTNFAEEAVRAGADVFVFGVDPTENIYRIVEAVEVL